MKLRTVGLLGLVLAHISAPALPDVCLDNYKKASDNLTKELKRLSDDETFSQGAGYGGAAAGVGSCLYKAPGIPAKLICSVVFVAWGYIGGFESGENVEKLRMQTVEAALIYQIYRDFKAEGARTELEKDTLAQIGLSSALDQKVENVFVRMMESRELCDSGGRPNKTRDQIVRAIQLKNLD